MNSFIKLLIIVQLLSNSVTIGRAQNSIDYKAEEEKVQFNIFKFEGTDIYDLVFPLTSQIDTFKIVIKAYISAGDLSIEIYDPTGERLGNFTVQGQSDLSKSFTFNFIQRKTSVNTTRRHIEKSPGFFTFNDENFEEYGMGGEKVAQASLSRLFKAPMNGDWVIKAVCNKAKGFFTVENNEYLLKSNMPTEFVNGIVVDNKNRPLAGAIIRSKNVYGGTTTNEKGEFTVSLLDPAEARGEPEIIEVRYKKMIKEVVIGDQPQITVVLQPKK